MTRPMKKWDLVRLVRREGQALFKLSPWLLASLLLAALLWAADLTTTSGLFQSPPDTPIPTVTEMPILPPTLTLTPTIAPPTPVTPTATVEPTVSVTPTASLLAPTEAPAVEPPPTVTPAPTSTVQAGEPETVEGEYTRYADEDVKLKFEWSMLFDSVVLGFSYLWLCCGVLIFLSIPVFFVVLWVAANRRRPPGQ